MISCFAILSFFFIFPGWLIAADVSNAISFFRAIEDKETYKKNPEKYERVVIRDSVGEHEYYRERQPIHVIPGTAIQAIIVRKSKKYGGSQKDKEDMLREMLEKKPPREFPLGVFYNVTFKIAPPESRRFSDFTEKNKGRLFGKRVGNRNLGASRFDLPFEPDQFGVLEFTIYLQEDDANRIKEMLSPFKSKVIWE